MIKLTDDLWIGSADEKIGNIHTVGIVSVLNVAQDLRGVCGWPDVEYAQVGLIDGPGNLAAAYYAAVLVLAMLLKRGRVLVFCHSGGRSLAVALMYLSVLTRIEWDRCFDMVRERVDVDLPAMHPAHKEVFDKMDHKFLADAVGE